MATVNKYKSNLRPLSSYNAASGGDVADALTNNNNVYGGTEKINTQAGSNGNNFIEGVGYLGEKVGLGFLSGIEGIWDYTAGGIASLFGADEWAEEQFADDWVNYGDADEWYNPSDGWKFAGDVFGGIGTSLPALTGVAAAAAITYFSGGTLSGLSAGIISGSIAGLGAAGQSTKEAYNNSGELGLKEYGYGALSGATEAGVEIATAGLAKGTGRIVSNIAKSTAKETGEAIVKSGAKSVIRTVAEDFATEAFEEGLQEILEPVYARMTYDKNAALATPQEVGYAALIGGLSGVIMSGGQAGVSSVVNSTANLMSGKKAVENGTAASVIEQSRLITETEAKNNTGNEVFQNIRRTYEELTASMANTDGQITGVKQKMLLGQLKRANVAAIFSPFVERSAMNILINAEDVAERYNSYGTKDANGNLLSYTAEELRSGVDLTADKKTVTQQIRTALSTNSKLAQIAVADATGHLFANAQKMTEAALSGREFTADDLNTLIERGNTEQISALSSALGIEDWSKLSVNDFNDKIRTYFAKGGAGEYVKQTKRIREAAEAAEIGTETRVAPLRFNSKLADGIYRIVGKDGGKKMNAAIIKEGNEYHVYDYDTGNITRKLTVSDVNRLLNSYHKDEYRSFGEEAEKNRVGDTVLRTETENIDKFAREKVPEYKKLSAPNQKAVRGTIRQAQAHGLSEADIIIFARLSAQSGVNIIFDKNAAGGDGMIHGNTVYVNPSETRERQYETILYHEIAHALTRTEKGMADLLGEAFKHIDPERSREVYKKYSEFYKKKGYKAEKYLPIVNDEVVAAYAEDVFTNTGAWDIILGEEPTVGEKVMSFIFGFTRKNAGNGNVSATGRKFAMKYRKLFREFAERNVGNNAFAAATAGAESYALSKTDVDSGNNEKSKINPYMTDRERADILKDKKISAPVYTGQADNVIADNETALSSNSKNLIKSAIKRVAEQFSMFENGVEKYHVDDIKVDVVFSSGSLTESTHKSVTNIIELSKLLPVLKQSVESAAGVECHDNRYYADNNTKQFYELVGGYIDGEFFVPVRFGIKEFYDGNCTLYIVVCQDKIIKTKVVSIGATEKTVSPKPRLVFGISIARIFKNVNSKDLLRYIPDDFLSEQQRTIKNHGIAETIEYTDNKNDEAYRKAVEKGDNGTMKIIVQAAAKKSMSKSKIVDENGNLIRVYHGTSERFTVFDRTKSRANMDIQGNFFSPWEIDAKGYGDKVNGYYINIVNPADENTGYKALRKYQGQNNAGIKAREYLESLGYDGVNNNDEEYIVFNSNQIKSADLITYDDDGKVIPISKRFNMENDDIRYALTDSENEILSKYTADFSYLDWSESTAEYPKAVTKKYKNVTVVERGKFYNIYDKDGKLIIRKMKTTRGVKVFNRQYTEEQKKIINKQMAETAAAEEAKKAANIGQVTGRVYTKSDAAALINDIVISRLSVDDPFYFAKGELTGKTRDEAIKTLYDKMNNVKPEERVKMANDFASYIIDSAVLTEIYDDYLPKNDEADGARKTLSVMKGFYHNVELSTIKPDVKAAYDKGAGPVMMLWSSGKRRGESAFNIKSALADVGVMLEANSESDIFIEALGRYNEAKEILSKEITTYKRTQIGTAEELTKLRSDIATDILRGFDERGYNSRQAEIILRIMKEYYHKINTSAFTADAIAKYGDKTGKVLSMWKAEKNGVSVYRLAEALTDAGVNIAGDNEFDVFKRILTTYSNARDARKATPEIKRIINRYNLMVETLNKERVKNREKINETNERNHLLGNLAYSAQKMKELKLGLFLNTSEYHSEVLNTTVKMLSNINFRGNISVTATRDIISDLRAWYRQDNPMLKYNPETANYFTGYYEPIIAEKLSMISEGEGSFSMDEVYALKDIMDYFIHFVEHYNKVYRDGKWIDAEAEAKRFIETFNKNEKIKDVWFMKFAGMSYGEIFLDPAALVRYMDKYDPNGFYTSTFKSLREGALAAQYDEFRIKKDYDAFRAKNKKYVDVTLREKVNYNGTMIPRGEFIGVYMSLQRNQAQEGLMRSGIAYIDPDTKKKVEASGFVEEVKITDEERDIYIKQQISEMKSELTDTDFEYIKILEKAYIESKELKRERDIQRLGISNVTEGYYYPMRSDSQSETIDRAMITDEMRSVDRQSFNAATVAGTKRRLFIESADTVFNRHIHGVCIYAHMSPAAETFNVLFNLDVSGNKNAPVSIKSRSANIWPKANQTFGKLMADIRGVKTKAEGDNILNSLRSGYVIAQLSANPKVLMSQLSSFFAAGSILDTGSIMRGIGIDAKDVDKYCHLAEIRNYDGFIAKAEGALDKITSKTQALMKPVGNVDRFVVKRLFGAAQVQVESDSGGKIKVGTEENKVAAGKLLERVILETQQNAIATEKSAGMRSTNIITRTLTMFSADGMKVIGRVIDSAGEYEMIRAEIKNAKGDAAKIAELKKRLKPSGRKLRKSLTALMLSAVYMASIGWFFRHIYDKDDEPEEEAVKTGVDMIGNLFGGLPILKDVYGFFADGYELDNYAYSTLNDLLNSAKNLMNLAGGIVTGESTGQEIANGVRKLALSASMMFGVPTRNVYNIFYGLTKRFVPSAAYGIDSVFYEKNYKNDLEKALEEGDDKMVTLLMGLLYNERFGEDASEAVISELHTLSTAGYKVTPPVISNKITVDGEERELTEEETEQIRGYYAKAGEAVESLLSDIRYTVLSPEVKAETVNNVYSICRDAAIAKVTGAERGNTAILSSCINVGKLAIFKARTKGITNQTDSRGNVIEGSRRKIILARLNSLGVRAEEKLLLLCSLGYAIKDGDIRGLSAEQAKSRLLRYILSRSGLTKDEKGKLATMCGFEVKNGKIILKKS